MMYKIIGGDGQEYGPVTEADLSKWIAEGRLGAQSLAKADSDAEFRPLSTFPEFAGALGAAAAAYGLPAPPHRDVDWSSRDYQLDIGGCISRGWNLFANNLGILFGSSVLYFVLVIILVIVLGFIMTTVVASVVPRESVQSATVQISQNLVLKALMALVLGPLIGGLYYIFIQTIRGRPSEVGDLFIGFQKAYPQLFLGQLVFTLALGVCFIPASIAQISRMAPVLAELPRFQHGAATPAEMQEFFSEMGAAFAGSLPVFLACVVPAIYLATNFLFTLPLIIDKGMDFWTAIKTSWRMAHKHWFTVFGLLFLTGLINLGGLCLCCVGFFFTFAFTTAALMFAYETIFGESRLD